MFGNKTLPNNAYTYKNTVKGVKLCFVRFLSYVGISSCSNLIPPVQLYLLLCLDSHKPSSHGHVGIPLTPAGHCNQHSTAPCDSFLSASHQSQSNHPQQWCLSGVCSNCACLYRDELEITSLCLDLALSLQNSRLLCCLMHVDLLICYSLHTSALMLMHAWNTCTLCPCCRRRQQRW